MKKFKNAIFDLDGTLLDSMAAWRNLGMDYLLHNKINPPSGLNEILAAMSMEEAAEYFRSTFNFKFSNEDIIWGIKSLIEDKYKYELILKPYVKEYLLKLKEEGVNMCIATASPSSFAKAALERNGIIKYFSCIISCDDVGAGKNKPDVFFLAAKKLGAKVCDTAVFDDADFALLTAKEAGFYTVGVYDEAYRNKRNIIESISDFYIESFSELLIHK